MTYSIIFPNSGWMLNIKELNSNNNISMLQFYCYKFSIRNDFNPFINSVKLSQQCIVDAWVKVNGSRLHNLRKKSIYFKNRFIQRGHGLYKE